MFLFPGHSSALRPGIRSGRRRQNCDGMFPRSSKRHWSRFLHSFAMPGLFITYFQIIKQQMIFDTLLYRIRHDITIKNSAFFRLHCLKFLCSCAICSIFFHVFCNYRIYSYIFSFCSTRIGYIAVIIQNSWWNCKKKQRIFANALFE